MRKIVDTITPSFDLTNLQARDIVFVEFVYMGKDI